MIRWFRRWAFKRQMRKLATVVRRIEATQTALGWPRWKRQQFWRTLVNSPRGRDTLVDILRGAAR